MAVQEELYELLTQEYSIEKTDLEPTVSLEELAIDSLDYLQMLLSIEQKFGIEINDLDRVSIEYVGDLVRTVEVKVANKTAASAN